MEQYGYFVWAAVSVAYVSPRTGPKAAVQSLKI